MANACFHRRIVMHAVLERRPVHRSGTSTARLAIHSPSGTAATSINVANVFCARRLRGWCDGVNDDCAR